ncbi:TVP38/TMEM64 family protein [Candidatus Microgenomates bacterium]|nr:TVP38/TMEM64 family protein [Candidatus Microgenomates bacterium]
MSRQTKLIASLTLFLTIVGFLVVLMWIVPNTQAIINFSTQHPTIAPLIVILWRILAIVIPPIPGGIVSLALIPVFGWWRSTIYAVIGIMTGVCIAFWLARKFREPLVRRFVPLQKLHKWEEKISKKKEFLAFLGVRFATDPVADFISYVAGLTKISFPVFFVATLISHLPLALTYYIGEVAFKVNVYLGILYIALFGIIFYVIKRKGLLEKL